MNTTVDKINIHKGAVVASPEYKPRTIAKVGVSESILVDLALKTLYLYGPFSVADLSEQSRLSHA